MLRRKARKCWLLFPMTPVLRRRLGLGKPPLPFKSPTFHVMINLGCYNLRGLNNRPKQVDVRSFLLNKWVSFVGLVETKVKCCNAKPISMYLSNQWKWHFNYAHHPKMVAKPHLNSNLNTNFLPVLNSKIQIWIQISISKHFDLPPKSISLLSFFLNKFLRWRLSSPHLSQPKHSS
jgi:hypothetical protein